MDQIIIKLIRIITKFIIETIRIEIIRRIESNLRMFSVEKTVDLNE